MKFEVNDKTGSEIKEITRIEIRCDGKSKSLTLNDHTNASKLCDILKDEFSKIQVHVSMTICSTDSPIRHVKKCMIQVYEATNKSIAVKTNFKSFTCYGMTDVEVLNRLTQIISAL